MTAATAAIGQVPAVHRRIARSFWSAPTAPEPRAGLLDWLTGQDAKRGRSVDYSVGFAVTEQVRTAVSQVPAKAWTTAIPARARRSSASRLETTERSVTALLRRGATHGEGW